MNFYRFYSGLRHFIVSSHRNGHGIHSPAVYKLIVALWGNKTKAIVVSSSNEDERTVLKGSSMLIVVLSHDSVGAESEKSRERVDRLAAIAGMSPKYLSLIATLAEASGEENIADKRRDNLYYIDGCQGYNWVWEYLQMIEGEPMEKRMIILDNINKNPELRNAWRELSASDLVTVSLEFSRMGVLLFDKKITPGRYVVRY